MTLSQDPMRSLAADDPYFKDSKTVYTRSIEENVELAPPEVQDV